VWAGFVSGTVATSVTAHRALYWLDPAALAQLKPGQPLDADPLTGEKYAVSGSSVGSR
jgi:hypothetical protein